MKAIQLPLFTTKDYPADAQIISHKLLVRAGYIKKQVSGTYFFLPFGCIVHRKIEEIIREEMNQAGAIEVQMPIIIPGSIWEKSGRWAIMGKEMMRFYDRHENSYVLGPTHEESISELALSFLSSYKQLPINLYQIGKKYRDEIRPRYGLIRCREFVMKDAYSFHLDETCLQRTYEKMRSCYRKIFHRCALETIAVEADSGAMGGASSEEFMVPSRIGEETLLICSDAKCGFQSNQEKTQYVPKQHTSQDQLVKNTLPSMEKVHTPSKKTIEEVSQYLNISKHSSMKTIVLENDNQVVIIFLPGSRDINFKKLYFITETDNWKEASTDTIVKIFNCEPGFLGPVGLKEKIQTYQKKEKDYKNIQTYFDKSLYNTSTMVVGANEKDYHLQNVSLVRDTNYNEKYFQHDFILVQEKDTCPLCTLSPLKELRGIEVGHIFQLGKKYTKSFQITVLDSKGKEIYPTMGCYGIGVGRIMATIVEQHSDEKGLVWPANISPYSIYLIGLCNSNTEQEGIDSIYHALQKKWDVYYDNRKERAGVKFFDFELVGFPIAVVVGKKYFINNTIEIKIRKSGKTIECNREELEQQLEKVMLEV